MNEIKQKQRLPPETEDKVIEVSLKHVIVGFTVVVATAFIVGSSIVLLRDYIRYRRQKSIVDNFGRVIAMIQIREKGGKLEQAQQHQTANAN